MTVTVLPPALRWESQGTQGCVYQAAVIKYPFYFTIHCFKFYSFWHLHTHTHSSYLPFLAVIVTLPLLFISGVLPSLSFV